MLGCRLNWHKMRAGSLLAKEIAMAKGQKKSNREVRKPKKEKAKTIAALPSRGTVNDIKAR